MKAVEGGEDGNASIASLIGISGWMSSGLSLGGLHL